MLKTQQQVSFHLNGVLAKPSLVSSTAATIYETSDEELELEQQQQQSNKKSLLLKERNQNQMQNQSENIHYDIFSALKKSKTKSLPSPAATTTSFNTTPKQPSDNSGSVVSGSASSQNNNGDSGLRERGRERDDEKQRRVNEMREDDDIDGDAKLPPGGDSGGDEGNDENDDLFNANQEKIDENFTAPLVWRNIILFIILHSALPIGIRMALRGQVSYLTLLWSLVGIYISGLGVTGGAHRLWSHKSYKASWPVQVLLMLLQTMAGQNSIYTWSRDHRVHHKFAETNADPHNIKRGFFFAHMGWLCCRKHPDVGKKGALIDMADLQANPIVMFQHRHFWWLSALCTVLIPSYIPVLLWNENFWVSFVFSFMLRYTITLHGTWLVNSAAHYFGSRPYDQRIEARESPFVILTGLGEGFHNYHHTFPFDYSTSEFGKFFNITTTFIDLCAKLNLVHDRRSMSRQIIEQRQKRTGDGSGALQERVKDAEEQEQLQQQGQQRHTRATRGSAAREQSNSSARERLVNNFIQELPYISGLTTMKYTM